ncbi:hypothetical protein M5K25_015489 [Dendrobium thyrsiflorum]|uniref:Uncharacterized protein n=1 Tax=Dendrobium thyrsiflorum TaxID=117978 RepID=A0ABD0UYB6_DENTH
MLLVSLKQEGSNHTNLPPLTTATKNHPCSWKKPARLLRPSFLLRTTIPPSLSPTSFNLTNRKSNASFLCTNMNSDFRLHADISGSSGFSVCTCQATQVFLL